MKRVRSRLGGLVVAASLASLPTQTAAMATVKPSKASRLQATSTYNEDTVAFQTLSKVEKYQERLQYYERRSTDEEDGDNFDYFEQLGSFQELQKSTGSEILNEELQNQIDQASKSPDIFLDAHMEDASLLEKVAMSSIPQQLPRPAVDALTKQQERTRKQKALNAGTARIDHEQEIELGKLIQRGVALHKLKADFEAKQGREISRTEWTALAKLKSPNELRRAVSDYRRAKQLLVSANMGLVHAVVNKQYQSGFVKQFSGLSKEELVQEGSMGLLRAAELFDPSRGLRFSTYATIWIKGTLQNSHVTDGSITLPQREKNKWSKIVKAHEELKKMNGEPTVEEIAHHLNMKVADVLSTKRKMTQAQKTLSLDYEYASQTRSGTDDGTRRSLEDDKAFREDADLAERTQMHADVIAAMTRNLDAREARLMRLRYGLADGKTRSIAECAEAMGLSQTRVQQLAKQCLKKLREAAEAESLEEYLLTVA